MIYLRLTILVLLAAVMAVLGVWTGDRNRTIEVLSVKQQNKPVVPGGTLFIEYDVRRFRSCDRDVHRAILDGENVRFDLGVQIGPSPSQLGNNVYVQPVQIPTTAHPGPSTYLVMIRDYCNPVHYLWPLVTSYEVPFVIEPGPTDIVRRYNLLFWR